jgi:hypothetical protein
MFVEGARSPDPHRLRFIRWLVDHNHFGHPAIGPSSGEFADTSADEVTPSMDAQP